MLRELNIRLCVFSNSASLLMAMEMKEESNHTMVDTLFNHNDAFTAKTFHHRHSHHQRSLL